MGMQEAAAPTDSTDWDSLLLIDSSWSTCQWRDGGIQFLREKTLEGMWIPVSAWTAGGGFFFCELNWVINSSVLGRFSSSGCYQHFQMRVSSTASAQKA